jgi:hypothetical protein
VTNQTGPYGGSQPPQQPQNPYGQQPPQNPYGQQPPVQGAPVGYPPPQNPYAQQAPQNPYGQTQQPQAPYGAQPPNAFGAQPVGNAPGWNIPPQKSGGFLKGSRFKTTRIIVIVVVVAGIGIAAFLANKSDPGTAAVGDCIHITNEDANSAKKVSCTDSSANFTVLQKYDNTTDTTKCQALADTTSGMVALYQYGRSSSEWVLCLAPKQ